MTLNAVSWPSDPQSNSDGNSPDNRESNGQSYAGNNRGYYSGRKPKRLMRARQSPGPQPQPLSLARATDRLRRRSGFASGLSLYRAS